MIITKEETLTQTTVDYVVCDRCKLKITPQDFVEWQEMLSIRMTGGYGSVLGDGITVETQLCQRCVESVLGEFLRTVGDDNDEDICDS